MKDGHVKAEEARDDDHEDDVEATPVWPPVTLKHLAQVAVLFGETVPTFVHFGMQLFNNFWLVAYLGADSFGVQLQPIELIHNEHQHLVYFFVTLVKLF